MANGDNGLAVGSLGWRISSREQLVGRLMGNLQRQLTSDCIFPSFVIDNLSSLAETTGALEVLYDLDWQPHDAFALRNVVAAARRAVAARLNQLNLPSERAA